MRLAVLVVAAAAGFVAYADDVQATTNVVVQTETAVVAPFSKDVVAGREDGTLLDRQRKLWPRLEAIAIRNGITNMEWIVTAYTNELSQAMAELAAGTNSLPREGLCIGLRFPLDNTSERKALEGYVVDQHYDAERGYDVLRIHFTKNVVEPRVALEYVSEASVFTNVVEGSWRVSQYLGSNWTNKTSVTWKNWTYDNVHTCFFKRPAGCSAMPLRVNPHLGWNLSGWGSTIVSVDGKETITGTAYDTQHGRYATFKNGHRIEPLWTYEAVSSDRLAGMKLRLATTNFGKGAQPGAGARGTRRKHLGVENY